VRGGGGWISHDILALVRTRDAYVVASVSINATARETLIIHDSGPLEVGTPDLYDPVAALRGATVSINLLLGRGRPAGGGGGQGALLAQLVTSGLAVDQASAIEQSLPWGRSPGSIRVILGSAPGGSLVLLSNPINVAAAVCHLGDQRQMDMVLRAHSHDL
jgi:hypothetical protein